MYLSYLSIYLSIYLGATAVGSPAIVKYINPKYASSTSSLDSTSTDTDIAADTTDVVVVEKEERSHDMDLLSVEDIKDIEALPPDGSSNSNSTIETKSTSSSYPSSSSSSTATATAEKNKTKIIIETWSTAWSPKEWPKEWFQNIDSSESVII
jgi:ABC-type Na+ efflux pump permease subunit